MSPTVPGGDRGPRPGMLDNLEQLIAHLPVAVYVCEAPSGVIRLYNARAVELWGRAPEPGSRDERFCGSFRLFRPDGTFLPPADTPMAEVLRDGGVRDDTVIIERPDGSRVTVRVSITALCDAAGRIVGAVNAFQDVTERQRVEEALRLSEARYRAIVEDQPEMVCRFLPDGTMTFANEAYCRYFGRRRAELLGRRYAPIVHPEDLPHVEAQTTSLTPARPVVVIENRVFRADGAVRWTQWTNRAIHDAQGTLVELQSTGRDITERKQAEADAARLAALVASAEDAIIGKTLGGVITSWNLAAERMFGYTAAEAIGQAITMIVPVERRPEEAELLARVRRGESVRLETARASRGGRTIPVSVTISPVVDGMGRITGASTIARDITDRRRAEEQIRSTVQTLEVLYRLVDRVGRASSVPAVCEAAVEAILGTGADRASILLLDESRVMRFAAWRHLSDAYRAAVDGHSPWPSDAVDVAPIVVEDVDADPALGALRDVVTAEGIRALAFVPLVDQGRLLGKFMTYYDTPRRFSREDLRLATTIARHVAFGLSRVQADAAIAQLLGRERSARQEADAARAEAEAANRAKDEFLAMLAHELRNPLGVIVNAIGVINDSAGLPAELRRPGALVRRQAEHLGRLLDDLLDVARITSGRIELDEEHVDLRTAVEAAVDAHRHRIDGKRQNVAVTLPAEPVTVFGDAVRLQQAIGNLVNNAVKYTSPGGSIHVSLGVEGRAAALRVQDDGVGIASDKLETIFDLFTQLNPTLARTEGGLGIGLTLVKRLIELHGGAVTAHSDGWGRGSEFVVRLPCAIAARPEPAPPPLRGAVTPRRVLVIEDHDDGREMVATTLRLKGHQVLEAAAGRDGIELATRHSPDVVLVDIGLPDVDGHEVGQQLRQKLGSAVRLIALTGYGQPRDRARSEEVGFDAHLVKPVDPLTLAETLQRLE